ncbi:MAG: hypothetical protein ACE5G9_08615, partial [Nitrospinales bacterium]
KVCCDVIGLFAFFHANSPIIFASFHAKSPHNSGRKASPFAFFTFLLTALFAGFYLLFIGDFR